MNLLNFCTLFDKGYLLRGLALIESLNACDPKLHIYVLAMDDYTANVLASLNLPNTTTISLSEFETPALLSIKAQRSRGEYCWTCTPSLIKFCLTNFNLDHCTYLDADTYFFASPRILIAEAGGKSVLLTEHFYTLEYDQTVTSGKYCVQFMYFKNDPLGMNALNWWVDKCIEWCFARHENGLFGDQKYLDDWMTRFQAVHELKHRGGSLAPWNIQQYKIAQSAPLKVTLKNSAETLEAVVYHFHDLKVFDNGMCDLGHYKLPQDVIKNIYAPYLRALERNKQKIEVHGFKSADYRPGIKSNFVSCLKEIKRRFNGNYHIFRISHFSESK